MIQIIGKNGNFKIKPEEMLAVTPVSLLMRFLKGEESIDVYDFAGEKVIHRTPQGENKIVLDVKALTAGIYFVTVRDEKNNLAARKFVKM